MIGTSSFFLCINCVTCSISSVCVCVCVCVCVICVICAVNDMENILVRMRSEEEDAELKRNFSFLFYFLKKNLLQPKIPPLSGEKFGVPPFEKPTIAKVL